MSQNNIMAANKRETPTSNLAESTAWDRDKMLARNRVQWYVLVETLCFHGSDKV